MTVCDEGATGPIPDLTAASRGRRNRAAEVEPFPDGPVLVSRGSVIDVCEWRHALPRSVK